MSIQIECPGCKSTLQVDDSLAGKQGKCIHCGHRVVVPGGDDTPGESSTSPLFEASPEAMMREISARGESAVLFMFKPTANGSYNLAAMPEADLKCIATDDVNGSNFGQVLEGIVKRFTPRKPDPFGRTAAPVLYELKGDRLGMSLDEFKRKYARGDEGSRERLPILSSEAVGRSKATLRCEPWHAQSGIIHARIDHPDENNSPTVAGVKTQLLVYHFIDGQLFRISAFFPTDLFHLVSEAAVSKYGPPTLDTQRPRQQIWENPVSSVVLTRGLVHPPEPSTLILVFRSLAQIADAREPRGRADI